jgi:hypothetical protein
MKNCHHCENEKSCNSCNNEFEFVQKEQACVKIKEINNLTTVNRYRVEYKIDLKYEKIIREVEKINDFIIKNENKTEEKKLEVYNQYIENLIKKEDDGLTKIYKNIIVNEIIFRETFKNSTEKITEIQGKNIDALNNVLKNETYLLEIFNKTSEDYNKNLIIVSFAIFKSSINIDYITYDKLKIINELALKLTENAPNLFDDRNSNDPSKIIEDIETENNFINIGSKISSNLISISKINIQNMQIKNDDNNKNTAKLLKIDPLDLNINSLIINSETNNIKKAIDGNLRNLLHLNQEIEKRNYGNYKNNITIVKQDLITENTYMHVKKCKKIKKCFIIFIICFYYYFFLFLLLILY